MARRRKPQTKKSESFRRANGSGCVSKLSGKRRKPYIAIVTTGFIFDKDTLKNKHLQEIIDNCDHSFATKNNIKTLMNGVFTYCMQNDIVSRNYTEYLEIEFTDSTFEREVFSKRI